MHSLLRLPLIASMLGLCWLWPEAGRAEEESKRVCASAFADAQRLMRSDRLIEAKEKLVLCGGPRCPQVMHSECQSLLFTVETSLSTVVFRVTLQRASLSETDFPDDVRIAVDGQEPIPFDGKAITLDPGAHDFTFSAHGFRTAERHIVVGMGEMLRREQVTLSPLFAIPPVEKPTLLPFATPEVVRKPAPRVKSLAVPLVITSSVAALASASAVYFGLQARSDDRALDSCSPTATCSVHDVDQVRREYLWTNISIGAAVAGLATTTVLFLLNSREPKKSNRTALGSSAKGNHRGFPVARGL